MWFKVGACGMVGVGWDLGFSLGFVCFMLVVWWVVGILILGVLCLWWVAAGFGFVWVGIIYLLGVACVVVGL